MPFVALLDHRERLDATYVNDAAWAGVHRVAPRRMLTCPDCGGRMRAVLRYGTRFFAHDAMPPSCGSYGETQAHLFLKRAFVEAVRAVPGWHAWPEHRVGDRRIADVLATDGTRRIAFEIQLAAQSAADTTARVADYSASGVELFWVVRNPDRLGIAPDSPWLRVASSSSSGRHSHIPSRSSARGHAQFNVAGPLLRYDPDPAPGQFASLGRPIGIARVVAAVLEGRLVWHAVASGWITPDDGERHRRAQAAWTPPARQTGAWSRRLDQFAIRSAEIPDADHARQLLDWCYAVAAQLPTQSGRSHGPVDRFRLGLGRIVRVSDGHDIVVTAVPERLPADVIDGCVVLHVHDTTNRNVAQILKDAGAVAVCSGNVTAAVDAAMSTSS